MSNKFSELLFTFLIASTFVFPSIAFAQNSESSGAIDAGTDTYYLTNIKAEFVKNGQRIIRSIWCFTAIVCQAVIRIRRQSPLLVLTRFYH